jgi:hypothetical protein
MVGHCALQALAAQHAAHAALLEAAAKPDSAATGLTVSQVVSAIALVAAPVIAALVTLVGPLWVQSRTRSNLTADLEIYNKLHDGDARTKLKDHIDASVKHLARSGVKHHRAFYAGLGLLAVSGFLLWVTSEVSNSGAVVTARLVKFVRAPTGVPALLSFFLGLWFFWYAFRVAKKSAATSSSGGVQPS